VATIEFVRNYDDLSTDQGFQFKFYCNHCGNGYMSTFVPNKVGMAADFLRAAGGIFGGALGNMGNSAYEVQRAVGGPAHDKALNDAVTEIRPLFDQCHRCGQWVCKQVCWNPERGLCKQCAPILAEETTAAQAQAAKDQIFAKAAGADMTQGVNITQQTAAFCPKCGAATAGAKFCPQCGAPLMARDTCPKCNTKIPQGAKFCPSCGQAI
jgi:hypothetical protein